MIGLGPTFGDGQTDTYSHTHFFSQNYHLKVYLIYKFSILMSINFIQSVTGPHRQTDRDDRPCREDHFLWRNMYSQTCRLWVMRRWRCSPVRVRIECRQLYTSFYWKRHVFTIRVQTVYPVPHCIFDIVAATIGQQGRATGPPRRIHCCCCPQRKKSRGVK